MKHLLGDIRCLWKFCCARHSGGCAVEAPTGVRTPYHQKLGAESDLSALSPNSVTYCSEKLLQKRTCEATEAAWLCCLSIWSNVRQNHRQNGRESLLRHLGR
jgi:hypothetical protein